MILTLTFFIFFYRWENALCILSASEENLEYADTRYAHIH